MTMSISRLMYEAPVRTERAGQFKFNVKEIARAQRLAVLPRPMIRAYRTVSGEALKVTASTLPVDLVARGKARLYASEELEPQRAWVIKRSPQSRGGKSGQVVETVGRQNSWSVDQQDPVQPEAVALRLWEGAEFISFDSGIDRL